MKSFNARFHGNPRVYPGLIWLAIVAIVAIFAGVLAPRDPFAIVGQPFLPPGSAGVVPGTDSLGASCSGQGGPSCDAGWLVAMPGIVILLTVLAINLIGEGLNDAPNPRLADL